MDSLEPYQYAHTFANNQLQLEIVLKNLAKQAKPYGVVGVKSFYNAYVKDISKKDKKAKQTFENTTDFTGCDTEMVCGEWIATDTSIYKLNRYGEEEIACTHPIYIKERLRNIDTGMVKLKIAFSENYRWTDIIVAKSVIASSNKIVELSDKGVSVTSESSKTLVRFLNDLEHLNYSDIPERRCCSRLGWIDGEGFAPYNDNLEFDGDLNLSHVFNSVKQEGDYGLWKQEIKKICSYNYINKIVLAASFAAPLIKQLGINNFFIHLWADTETAKTVSIICAASVWANPRIGKYIQTFNSTNVGKEKFAEIANTLPVFFDELEIATDRTSFDREIYELSEGAGRLRGNKYGTTDKTSTWHTCFITTGEKPIITENSKGGAMNRIVEVHCTSKLIENGRDTCEIIYNNYGYAGKEYIEAIEKAEGINNIYKHYYKELEYELKTEKQTSIGAALLTSMHLASNIIFGNEIALTVSEVSEFLNSKETMNIHARAYNYMMEYISRNSNKFTATSTTEILGKLSDMECYIIKSVFDKICEEQNYNPTAFLSWLATNGKLTKKSKDKNTASVRINGIKTRCVCIAIDNDENNPFEVEHVRNT